MPHTRVTVFAPATIANVGPGYDALGIALERPGDIVIATRIPKPGLLGGVCLVRGGDPPDVVRLKAKDAIEWIVAHPHVVVETAAARRLVPRRVPLESAVRQWANVGGLVAGLLEGDAELVGRSIE